MKDTDLLEWRRRLDQEWAQFRDVVGKDLSTHADFVSAIVRSDKLKGMPNVKRTHQKTMMRFARLALEECLLQATVLPTEEEEWDKTVNKGPSDESGHEDSA